MRLIEYKKKNRVIVEINYPKVFLERIENLEIQRRSDIAQPSILLKSTKLIRKMPD